MTTPVAHGFSDFNRATPNADVLVVSDTSGSTSGTKNYTLTFCGNQRSFFVWCNIGGNPVRVRIAFYGDAAGSNLLETFFIHGSASDLIFQPVRVMGPYVQVSVDAGGGLLSTYTLQVWATPDYGSFNSGGLLSGAMSNNSTAIGAGATITQDNGLVLAGPAVWSAFCASGNFSARLESVQYDGTVTVIDLLNSSYQAGGARTVYLPPTHFRLVVINSGAASAFNASVTRLHP